MNDLPLSVLFGILAALLLMSAIFSGSETGMMALNRYRLKALAQQGHRPAQRALHLLAQPDRLLGVILLGNNFVNILASSIATVIAMRIAGEPGIAIGAGILTLVVLIFSEVAPKTLAAMYPEKIAFPATYFLDPLLKLLSPLVLLVNFVANNFLRLLGVELRQQEEHLTPQELEAIIENMPQLPKQYRDMLKSILRMEQVTVEDVLIPKSEIYAIDVNLPLEEILRRIAHAPYTRIPLYRGSLDEEILGILNIRKALPLLLEKSADELALRDLIKLARPAYFVPNTTPLTKQLGQFRQRRRRMALVVDEYGDLIGLLTMEDLLEEIVGELSMDKQHHQREDIVQEENGCLLAEGGVFIRDLNKEFDFTLPTDGPKTLNGLVQEVLEALPNPGTSLRLEDYVIEVVDVSDNAVEKLRICPLQQERTHD